MPRVHRIHSPVLTCTCHDVHSPPLSSSLLTPHTPPILPLSCLPSSLSYPSHASHPPFPAPLMPPILPFLDPDKPGGDTAKFQQLQASYQEILKKKAEAVATEKEMNGGDFTALRSVITASKEKCLLISSASSLSHSLSHSISLLSLSLTPSPSLSFLFL
jgi:hypothetical protein